MLAICLVSLGLAPNRAWAEGGVVKKDDIGCRELSDAKKAAETKKGGKAGIAPSGMQVMASGGGCVVLQKGRRITVDDTQGAFICVRAQGDLDCLWAARSSIDEHAGFEAQPLTRPASPMPLNRNPATGPVTRGASETVTSGFKFNDLVGGSGGALRGVGR